jgi:putative MATE family efflux protein
MVGSIYRGVAGVGFAAQVDMMIFTVVFGINVGIGIYIAQFYGAKDKNNMANSFALNLVLSFGFTALMTVVVFLFPEAIISILTKDPEVMKPAVDYIRISVFAYIPNALSFTFVIAYRNIHKTKVPLYISTFSQSFNVLFNYLLIFGIGPFPQMGVKGAAIATVIANSISILTHILYAIRSKQMFLPTSIVNFRQGLKPAFYQKIMRRVIPFIINEFFFSIGMIIYVILISRSLGSDAYEGFRMAETVVNLMYVILFGMGSAVAAMIGEVLGRKDMEQAENYGRYFLFLGLIGAVLIAGLNAVLAGPLIGLFHNDSAAVVANANRVMYAFSLRLFLRFFVIILFSIFRAGGEAKFVMFLDAGILWLVGVPLAFILSQWLGIKDVAIFYLIMQIEPLIRVIIGLHRYKKRTWIKNITDEVAVQE